MSTNNKIIGAALGGIIGGVAGIGFSLGLIGIVLAIGGSALGGALPTILEAHARSKITILILDDDQTWLDKHSERLKSYGFKFYSTQYAEEAIEKAEEDPSIRFGLIDKLLLVPNSKNHQDIQGKGVVDAIHLNKPEMKFIMVTDQVIRQAKGNLKVYREMVDELQIPGVVLEVIDKDEIEGNPDKQYKRILDLIMANKQ